MSRQKATDAILDFPGIVVATLMGIGLVYSLVSGNWEMGGLFAIGIVLSIIRIYGDHMHAVQAHEEDKRTIRQFCSREFEDTLLNVRQMAVPISGALADPAHFPPTANGARHYYFEWREIVFRLEADPAGKTIVSLRD